MAIIEYDGNARAVYTECHFTPEYREFTFIGDKGKLYGYFINSGDYQFASGDAFRRMWRSSMCLLRRVPTAVAMIVCSRISSPASRPADNRKTPLLSPGTARRLQPLPLNPLNEGYLSKFRLARSI